MSDSVSITPGTGADIAADDVGGLKFQRIKLAIGSDGLYSGDVSSANPLPILSENTDNLLRTVVSYLSSPMGFDRSLSRARNTSIIESGTITTVGTVTAVTTVSTVTSVTTVGTINSLGSLPAQQLAVHQNQAAWFSCMRSRIT